MKVEKFLISFGLIDKTILILLIYLISEIINNIITGFIPDDAYNSIILLLKMRSEEFFLHSFYHVILKIKEQKQKKLTKNSYIYFFYSSWTAFITDLVLFIQIF